MKPKVGQIWRDSDDLEEVLITKIDRLHCHIKTIRSSNHPDYSEASKDPHTKGYEDNWNIEDFLDVYDLTESSKVQIILDSYESGN